MDLRINLRHLDNESLHLQGEIPAAELDIDGIDELIQARQPLLFDLEVQKLDDAILATGRLELALNCECSRCLKPFEYRLLWTDWAGHYPLTGEEAVPILNDCVDLTPQIREDILLGFPQHPLCQAECGGLPQAGAGKRKKITGGTGQTKANESAWAELNKLKF